MKNVVISLKKMKKKKKILNYIVFEGPQAPQHESDTVDAQKTCMMWQVCSHAHCPCSLHGRPWEWHQFVVLQRWEVGGSGGEGWVL